jgi:hypothetical protein
MVPEGSDRLHQHRLEQGDQELLCKRPESLASRPVAGFVDSVLATMIGAGLARKVRRPTVNLRRDIDRKYSR